MCCKGKVEPEKMPPTERVAFLHGLRVHLQIVTWKNLDDEVCICVVPQYIEKFLLLHNGFN